MEGSVTSEESGAVSVAEKAALPAKNRELRFGNKWEYAPAQEAADYIKIPVRQELFINGEFVQPHSGKYFPSINPANEELLGEVATADESDVDKAVQAARTAYENVWSKISALERGKYVYRIARLIQENARELAVLESMDGGKPIKESRDVD